MSISEAMIHRASGEYDCEVVVNLKLEGMRIRNITNMDACVSLVDLSLARNEIMSLNGLETLVNLKRLDVSFNRIRKLDGLQDVSALEWLDLKGNSISSIDEVASLSKNPRLNSLFLRDQSGADANHACEHPAYKTIVLRHLPNLQVLDGGLVGLIDMSDQLEKHLQGLKPVEDETVSNLKVEKWFDDVASQSTEDVDNVQVDEIFPGSINQAEKVQDMLREESTYILRLATSAINKANAPNI